MIFHRVKFHRSLCRLAIANSERLLRTAISMNKFLLLQGCITRMLQG